MQIHNYVHYAQVKEVKSMMKVTMLAALIGGLSMGSAVAYDAAQQKDALAPRDTRIIVEVDRSLDGLTKEGINNTQDIVLNRIRNHVTRNIKVISQYSYLNNAFAISVNSEYVEQIKSLPGVKSVTVDTVHFKTYSVPQEVDYASGSMSRSKDGDIYGGSENVSAETMNMPDPDDTNDGEGTVVAILDNEFYLRGAYVEDDIFHDPWNHVTFTDLDEGTVLKFPTRPNISSTFAVTGSRVKNQILPISGNKGKEGSLYYNSKVPFYFDYGGDQKPDNDKFFEDFDVSSKVSYHGSHVASITAGNDPDYKGIAPKAQLVLMKVFTNLAADEIEKKLGLGDSTGAYDIPILNALEDCIALGVDGINMSLGSDLNDFDLDSITLKTLQKLADSGILTSISAGNAGKASYSFAGAYGNWTTDMVETGILGSYANNHNTTSVASAHALKSYYKTAFKFGEKLIAYEDQILTEGFFGDSYTKEYKLEDLITDERPTVDYIYLDGFGESGDYTESVDGKVVIVNRGSTSFSDKLSQAANHGAVGLVIINNDPTSTDFNFHISLGDITDPGMPIVLCLFNDKQFFKANPKGTLDKNSFLGDDHVQDNERKGTLSTFSSDGATFDLDLKPEITAPGDSIRGAVPPQTKDDAIDRPLSTYEFLSGTSMSAPNYAGVQSLMLSKVGKGYYSNPKTVTTSEYNSFKSTIDLRIASTANPLHDYDYDPEYFEDNAPNTLDPLDPDNDPYKIKNISSPRIQGAGMVDIDGAYHTKVYLNGTDYATGSAKSINKTKINLRNSSLINKGIVDLQFDINNEDSVGHTYHVTYSIMRPAVKYSNEFISSEYNKLGEFAEGKPEGLAGFKHWKAKYIPDSSEQGYHIEYELVTESGSVKDKDVYKITRDVEYYATKEDCINKKLSLFKAGNYYFNSSTTYEGQNWVPVPKYPYQSTIDTVIEEVDAGEIVAHPGKTRIDLDDHTINSSALAKLNSYFEFGTYLEGFVTLTETSLEVEDKIDLNIPWMGFYAGEGFSYDDAPAVEPFDFEKEDGKVYPSDLVNDISISLMGKSEADFHSTMVSTYVAEGKDFDFDSVLDNDKSLNGMAKSDPTVHAMGEYTDAYGNTKLSADYLYAGNPHSSNTIVLQQYVMRSVMDNYFTITNKATGEVYVRSVLLDSIYDRYHGSASQMGKYPLFKSHVDQSYMSAGVMAHRAYAIISLYDPITGEAFPSGDYDMTFNYQLAGTENWQSKSYTLHIDSDSPTVESLQFYNNVVQFKINDDNLTNVAIGGKTQTFTSNGLGESYVQIDATELRTMVNDNFNDEFHSGRLYINLTDRANGKNSSIIRFKKVSGNNKNNAVYDFKTFTMVEHYGLVYSDDFSYEDGELNLYNVDRSSGDLTPIYFEDEVKVFVNNEPTVVIQIVPTVETTSSGCGGSIATTSVVLTVLSSTAIILLIAISIKNKKKKIGGNK
jgi:hypothetical protein